MTRRKEEQKRRKVWCPAFDLSQTGAALAVLSQRRFAPSSAQMWLLSGVRLAVVSNGLRKGRAEDKTGGNNDSPPALHEIFGSRRSMECTT